MRELVGKGTVRFSDKRVVVDLDGGIEIGLPSSGSFTALDLLAMSLAGCVSTYIKLVFEKLGIDVMVVDYVEGYVFKKSGDGTISRAVVRIKLRERSEKLIKVIESAVSFCPIGVLMSRAGVRVDKEFI